MSAYVVVDTEVAEPYEDRKRLAPAAVALSGGKYLARGGATEVLEGDWRPHRLVILEFETAARAKEWLQSEDYRAARQLRHRTARSNLAGVEAAASP